MTALLLYPLGWRAVPTFSHQPLMFYFLFLVTFVFSARYGGICGGREVSDSLPGRRRAHQGAAYPQLPKTSDHLVQRWAENSLQQPHVSVLSPRLGLFGGPEFRSAGLLRSIGQTWEFNTVGRFPSICLHTPCQSKTEVYEQILVQSLCSSAKLYPVIKQVIISPLLTLQAVIEG